MGRLPRREVVIGPLDLVELIGARGAGCFLDRDLRCGVAGEDMEDIEACGEGELVAAPDVGRQAHPAAPLRSVSANWATTRLSALVWPRQEPFQHTPPY